MLLKIERTILRKTSTHAGNSIQSSEIRNFPKSDVYQAFLDLEEKGYFRKVSACMDFSTFNYQLSIKGKYYKEYLTLQFIKNFLIPFIVSIITATATYHLEKVADSYSTSCSQQRSYELTQDSQR